MSKQKENSRKKKDLAIKAILVIIIIVLLLHNCTLIKNKSNEKSGKETIIDITCKADKCQQPDAGTIDCLENESDEKCIVPDFKGKTKKELLRWLNLISNTIEIEIKLVEDQNYADGTIISQSVVGTSVKGLLTDRTKLVITIANNGLLINCTKNSKNSECNLPNFVGKKISTVENWLNGIANNISIKYIYIDSNKPAGTIISQSIKEGVSITDISDNNQTLIIYISKGKKTAPNNSNQKSDSNSSIPSPTPKDEPDLDDNFYANDNEKVKWQEDVDLKIFEDSSNISKVNGKIAPESHGTYKFVVNNGTKYNLKYKISFIETNHHGMNIKYKLKKGNTYLVDQYVASYQLNIDDMLLDSKSSDTYYLEWKWDGENDDNDTQIGKNAKNINVSYDLNIKIEAESA